MALLALCTVSVFALSTESEITYTNIPLYKIYNHQEGYVALYTKDGSTISKTYLPMSWIKSGSGKCRVIDLPKGLYPYMSVFYKNGEFQFVTLAVPKNPADPFWGVLPPDSDVSSKFDVETIVLE